MCKIMIAEDEYLVLMGLKAMVEKLGHTVISEAKDGKEAIEKALMTRPDLILMDINLPIINGISVMKKLYQRIQIPVVMITGYSDIALVKKANSVGVLGYLVKPISNKDLGPAIEIALSRFNDIQGLKKEVKDGKTQLEHRKIIEKAKGIIMSQRNLDENTAYKWIQQECRNNNLKLIQLAKQIIELNRKTY